MMAQVIEARMTVILLDGDRFDTGDRVLTAEYLLDPNDPAYGLNGPITRLEEVIPIMNEMLRNWDNFSTLTIEDPEWGPVTVRTESISHVTGYARLVEVDD